MCHYDVVSERGETAAAYYPGQPGQARTVRHEAPPEPGGEQTRRFDAPPAGAPAPGADMPTQQPGSTPSYYGWHGRRGRGFPRPLFGLFVLLFLVLALHGMTVGSVLGAIGSLPIIWPVLIFGAFAMLSQRRRGIRRW
jgi:hypothetical protein